MKIKTKPKPPKGRRVIDRADKTKTPGTVIAEGEQVSEVKWDDGTQVYIGNEWLENIQE